MIILEARQPQRISARNFLAIPILTGVVCIAAENPALAMTPMDDLGVLLGVVFWGGPLSLIGIFTAIWIALRRDSAPPVFIGIANALLSLFAATVSASRTFSSIASRHAMLHEPGPSFFSMKMAKLFWPWCIPLFFTFLPVMLKIYFSRKRQASHQAGPSPASSETEGAAPNAPAAE